MFWGLIMEPNKRYTQAVEKPFHISQAALDTSTGDVEPCQVMVVVDNKNFLICTLQKNKCIQVPLDLYFKTGDAVSFLANGKCNVHLTGYLDPEFEDEESGEEEEDDEEEEEEVPTLIPAKNKRKLENSNDAAAKKPKQEKKAAKKAKDEETSDSDDEEDGLQKFLDQDATMDTDEDDESFKVNTSAEGDDSDEDESDDDEEENGEVAEAEEDGKSSEEANTTLDTSKEETVDMSKLTKSQRRRLKKKLAQQAKEGKDKPQVNGVDKAKKDKLEAKVEKKKPDAKKADNQEPAEKKEKKSLTGGVSIEDTKVGNGPVAKPGKVVMVYYEGRLKSNNKKFDDCLKGPGFKFRLGAKEVISGWDVGINGMKVGGKRKIVCPPSMAYGAKGSPPVIPPNSTLVFDVELKSVK